jgi:hypothetical protein
MGKIFDETGRVRNREDLLSISIGGRPGLRKVSDESTELATITRVEDESGSSLNITPKTVDFSLAATVGED